MFLQSQIDRGSSKKIAEVVRDAGGELVGRTRLQKTIYILTLAGYIEGFDFEYRHYGPYSEQVSQATTYARMFGELTEEERSAGWGGTYSIYRASGNSGNNDTSYRKLLQILATVNPVALELAATAAFLFNEGFTDPWAETEDRKSDKSSQISAAKKLYAQLRALHTPDPLPSLP